MEDGVTMQSKYIVRLILAGSLVLLGQGASPALADGTAKATLTIDGNAASYSGGSCIQQGSVLSLSIGVVPTGDVSASSPDYFGAYIPDAPGNFKDGSIAIVKNGKAYNLSIATGTATAAGATFSGSPLMQPGVHVQGSFKC